MESVARRQAITIRRLDNVQKVLDELTDQEEEADDGQRS